MELKTANVFVSLTFIEIFLKKLKNWIDVYFSHNFREDTVKFYKRLQIPKFVNLIGCNKCVSLIDCNRAAENVLLMGAETETTRVKMSRLDRRDTNNTCVCTPHNKDDVIKNFVAKNSA